MDEFMLIQLLGKWPVLPGVRLGDCVSATFAPEMQDIDNATTISKRRAGFERACKFDRQVSGR
jgi:hypothetical protein